MKTHRNSVWSKVPNAIRRLLEAAPLDRKQLTFKRWEPVLDQAVHTNFSGRLPIREAQRI